MSWSTGDSSWVPYVKYDSWSEELVGIQYEVAKDQLESKNIFAKAVTKL